MNAPSPFANSLGDAFGERSCTPVDAPELFDGQLDMENCDEGVIHEAGGVEAERPVAWVCDVDRRCMDCFLLITSGSKW